MTQLTWDASGDRTYETGIDRGVLYLPDGVGNYPDGVAWNGLTTVTESPSGAEATPQYADNIKYLNLISAEDFGLTVEALTYPIEFEQFDGGAVLHGGVVVHQQSRKTFGLSYRSLIGNDIDGQDAGEKLHLAYGCQAAPSERALATVNDSPEASTLSWELSTTPVSVGGGLKPTALITVDSTRVPLSNLNALKAALWGTAGTDPRLPLPDEVIAMFAGTLVVTAQPAAPTYNSGTRVVTIPTTTGVIYSLNGVDQPAGTYTLATGGVYGVVKARPAAGYVFPATVQDTWVFGPTA